MMKAILLCGGQGTRLREITGGLPKPLMPILGTPLLVHTVNLLRQNGFRELCLTLCYRPEAIRDCLGDGSAYGVHIEYREETAPMGTAGAVRNCRDFIGKDNVLVMSGDSACDFSLSQLMEQHTAGVTIALAAQANPLPYGLVVTDRSGSVTAFLEKPSWERVVTDQVSTGIYVLSPDVIDRVPAHEPYDFARNLFPRLLTEGVPMRGFVPEGYWLDIGTPRSYYQCNLDALDGIYRLPGQDGAARRILPCRDRARLMGAISRTLVEFGADLSDGLTLEDGRGRAHLAPLSDQCALALEGDVEAVRALEALARRLDAGGSSPNP